MHTTQGRLIYDPHRGDMKRRTEWWCVLDLDREITRYYRWWLNKEVVNRLGLEGKNLCQPSWDAHVSVVRGEKPAAEKEHLWKKYHKERFTIKYEHVGQFYLGKARKGEAPGVFFIVEVDAPELLDIRRELGLKCDWKLHLSFGRMYT